jgi:serine/threonine-protein kinase
LIGDVLDGRYEILRLIGRGGMGAVYEARHTQTGRKVAVKVIDGAAADGSPDATARFQREARAAGAVETQHIVQVLDSGVDPPSGTYYLVMEHLDGEDLQHLLDRVGVLAPDVVMRIAAQVCRGLAKAHGAGVIHRDIKPANLFLTRREDGDVLVKILDFGIAKIQRGAEAGVATGNMTQTGSMLGSPRYLAPEQARASKGIDARADLWSLGVVLYRALTGRTPHDAPGLVELIMLVCTEPPAPVQDVAPWVPPDVAAILDRTLRIAPVERWASADAMLDALRAVLPDGTALDADQLVSLDEAVRNTQAPRFTAAPAERTRGTEDGMSVTARSSPGGPGSVPAPRSGAPEQMRGGSRLRAPLIAVAACLVGVAGTFAFVSGRASTAASAPEAAMTASAPDPPRVTPASSAAPLAPPSAGDAAPRLEPRTSASTKVSAASSSNVAPPRTTPTSAAPRPSPPVGRPAAKPANQGFDPSSPF